MVFEYPSKESLQFYLDPSRVRIFTFNPQINHLSINDQEAVKKLMKAAELVDDLFLMQDHPQSLEVKKKLMKDSGNGNELAKLGLGVFSIFNGPEGKTYENETVPLFKGISPRPKGGTMFSQGVTAEEIESFLKEHPELREEFYKINTLIVKENNHLRAIPYELIYSERLKEASALIESAGEDVSDNDFKVYLKSRAKALVDGDYFPSDVLWLKSTTSPIDFIIGPLEDGGDRILGKKSFYAGLVCIKNPEESKRVEAFVKQLQALENLLPQAGERAKKMDEIVLPVAVVDIIYMSGDYQAKRPGIVAGQTLPNDEKVLEVAGRKIFIYKNVLETLEIEQELLDKLIDPSLHDLVKQRGNVNFTVSHEIAHSLGPKFSKKKDETGNFVSVREVLGEWNGIIEELKADIAGLFCMPLLMQEKIYSSQEANEVLVRGALTQVLPLNMPDLKRDMHVVGRLVTLNYFIHEGTISLKNGRFFLDLERVMDSVRKLLAEVLEVQNSAEPVKAEEFIRKWAVWSQEAQYSAKIKKECKVKLYKLVKQPLAEELLKI